MNTTDMSSAKEIQCRLSRDGSPVAGRIYSSTKLLAGPSSLKIATVAHPYGPLGGSFDDPTVLLIVKTLLSSGYDVVGTFNFRRPSWTLKPEIADFSAFSLFLMLYGRLMSDSRERSIHMLAAGYSYGSLVASQVPALSRILGQGSQDAAFLLEQAIGIVQRQDRTSSALTTTVDSMLSDAAMSTSYLLVSPILSPTTNLVAPFNRSQSFLGRIDSSSERCSALAIFGDKDAFTGSHRLEAWAGDNNVEYQTVQEAGHFWQIPEHQRQLSNAVSKWVGTL